MGPATTRYIWAMAHGGKKFPSRIWLGTDPGGLFLSEDNGKNFQLVESLWNHPTRKDGWFGGGRDQPVFILLLLIREMKTGSYRYQLCRSF
jgi:hypothetical protein